MSKPREKRITRTGAREKCTVMQELADVSTVVIIASESLW